MNVRSVLRERGPKVPKSCRSRSAVSQIKLTSSVVDALTTSNVVPVGHVGVVPDRRISNRRISNRGVRADGGVATRIFVAPPRQAEEGRGEGERDGAGPPTAWARHPDREIPIDLSVPILPGDHLVAVQEVFESLEAPAVVPTIRT